MGHPCARPWRVIILLLWVVGALSIITGRPEAQVLALDGPVATERVFSGHVSYLRDPSGQLRLDEVQDIPFQPIAGTSADFGYTRDALWLKVSLQNVSVAQTDWRIHLRENFIPEFDLWLLRADQAPALLEHHNRTTPFSGRTVAYPEVVVPFQLPPGAGGTLLMRYTSGGSSELSFAFHTEQSFEHLAARKTAKNFIYYGMMLFLVISAALAFAITRRGVFAAYSGYALSGLLFLMHADGNAFQYLWPDFPVFNAYASVLVGAGIIIFGANFARIFLQTAANHPVFDKLLIGLMLLTFGMVAATAVIDAQPVKKALVLLALLSLLLFTLAGLNAARTRFSEVRFYILAWAGAVVSSAIMTGRHWLGIEISEEVQFDSMRIVLLADAAFMGLAILDRFNQLKRARQQAMEASISETRRNLDLSRRLADLEEQYELAVALAHSSERRIADTVHDLRGPLSALRLNVQRLLHGRSGGPAREDFDGTFDYLEGLVSTELARFSAAAPPDTADDTADADPFPINLVLGAISEMFESAAAAKGLRLRHVRCAAPVDLPPLVLMRIAGNLVSNAIKYTPAGKVLIGCRRRAGRLWLEVHDTGPGMTEDEFAHVLTRQVRLDGTEAEGAGLGLAIVQDLVIAHGLELRLLARRGSGCSVAVSVGDAKRPG
jgi:two-component system, sensor histidine kinase LadS